MIIKCIRLIFDHATRPAYFILLSFITLIQFGEVIRNEMRIHSVRNKTDEYRQNWRNHLNRTADVRAPIHILRCKSKGNGDRGRPWKRLAENVQSQWALLSEPWRQEEREKAEYHLRSSPLYNFSPRTCHFLSLKSKYSPQHFVPNILMYP
jgi:hypothetical protein